MAQNIVAPVSFPAATSSAHFIMCDLSIDTVDSPYMLPMLAKTLAVLTMPLETECMTWLVMRVMQPIAARIHDLYVEEHSREETNALYAVVVDKCAWRLPTEAGLAGCILAKVSNELRSLHCEDSMYAVVMCAYNLLAL
ncbi:hypothetical protein GGF37_002691 [Kickxella alabastrina]|nr:hypothetical protein GGF37_002691 [Kickxella alabastrina]